MTKIALTPIKLHEWPERDRHLWSLAQQQGGLFDDGGFASGWRPATLLSVERGYGLYLAWLKKAFGLAADVAPSARVNKELIQAFMEAYGPGRAELTVATAVRGVAYVVRATSSPEGLPWLTKLAHRLTNRANVSRPKLSRMAPIADLTALGVHLMEEGQAALADGKVSGAQVFRDGLMVASLTTRLLRRRNLAGLRIGHTIFVDGARAHVSLSGKETKNRRALEFDYPDWLVEPFTFYIREVRPILLIRSSGRDEGWLWIGRRGRALADADITARVTRVTGQYLGRKISPHMFRDCAATDIALLDPEHIGITKSVLGHATLVSSQKYYNQAGSFAAVGKLAIVMAGLGVGKHK